MIPIESQNLDDRTQKYEFLHEAIGIPTGHPITIGYFQCPQQDIYSNSSPRCSRMSRIVDTSTIVTVVSRELLLDPSQPIIAEISKLCHG